MGEEARVAADRVLQAPQPGGDLLAGVASARRAVQARGVELDSLVVVIGRGPSATLVGGIPTMARRACDCPQVAFGTRPDGSATQSCHCVGAYRESNWLSPLPEPKRMFGLSRGENSTATWE